MAFGTKDARGIYQFGEDDAEATFSQLLNKGMQSVSDATKYFSGTPAERAALTPAPEGAYWQDTDTLGRSWRGVGGAWVRQSGRLEVGTITLIRGVLNPASVQSITCDGELATLTMRVDNGNGLTLSTGYQVIATIPAGMRPAKEVVFPGTRADAIGGALVKVAANGQVSAASSGSSVTFAVSYPVA